MKTYQLIIPFFFIFACMGCSEKFLDLAPISNANVENYYKSTKDFENAMVGAYSSLRSSGVYHDYIQLIGDLRSDNTEMGTTASVRFNFFELSEFRDQVLNTINTGVWEHHYRGIRRVHEILSKINGLSDATESFKERIEGEARFLRALYYFNLVRVFGDVPLVTSRLGSVEDAYAIGRTAKSEVYDQIIEDLLYAGQVLPASVKGEEGRATKGAALALLGKVYLTIHDFDNAKNKLAEVINSTQYDLLDDYGDLWIVANKNHKESVFDVQFRRAAGTSTGSDFAERYTPYLYPYLPWRSTGGGYNIPTVDMVNAYEDNDLRKDKSLREFYVNTNDVIVDGLEGRHCIKYFSMPTQGQGSDDNWPVIRYADVLLMYAEALNEISFESNGLAFTYLNKIRTRAGLPEKTAGNPIPALSVDSQQAFRLAIEQERRVELAFEGHRWFDLVRTGRAIEVLNPRVEVDIKEYQLVLPIPQDQVDINPARIQQNQGYGI